MDYRWYVAAALAGLEATAIYHLSRAGITAFSPSIGVGVSLRRLFPGYVFVELESVEEAGVVNRQRGIHRMLPVHANEPLALPRGFVEDLRGGLARGDFDAKACGEIVRKYCAGEAVPIVAGAYSGHYGEMVRYRKGSLIVLLSLFGGQREVPIPQHCVAMAA